MTNSDIRYSVISWQIALRLVRQGATIEPAVVNTQDIEPKEPKVDSQDRLADNCDREQMSETSVEADKEQTEL